MKVKELIAYLKRMYKKSDMLFVYDSLKGKYHPLSVKDLERGVLPCVRISPVDLFHYGDLIKRK